VTEVSRLLLTYLLIYLLNNNSNNNKVYNCMLQNKMFLDALIFAHLLTTDYETVKSENIYSTVIVATITDLSELIDVHSESVRYTGIAQSAVGRV